jgi:hypothetical protein
MLLAHKDGPREGGGRWEHDRKSLARRTYILQASGVERDEREMRPLYSIHVILLVCSIVCFCLAHTSHSLEWDSDIDFTSNADPTKKVGGEEIDCQFPSDMINIGA